MGWCFFHLNSQRLPIDTLLGGLMRNTSMPPELLGYLPETLT